jgi:hypothetical protein
MIVSPSAVLRFFALFAVGSFLTSSSNSLGADSPNAPQKLVVKWGSDLFGWWKIELEGQNVVYTKHYANKLEDRFRNKPQTDDWKAFREALDGLKVWQWQPAYPNAAGVVDGAQWSAEIVYPGSALKVTADNNYPDGTGSGIPDLRSTDTFRAFVRALWKLMGSTTEEPPPTN